MITNASREGARAGIVYHENSVTGEYEPISDADIRTVVDNYLRNNLITFGGPVTATTTPAHNNANRTLSVTVAYRYSFLVLPNFVGSLAGLGGGLNLTAQTVMRME
jgi:hypothetical protein